MLETPRQPCVVKRLGRVAYEEGLRLQEELVARRQSGEIPDSLVLLEHPKVITLGRNSHRENLLLDEAELDARGYGLFEVGRGGDVTCHGPGQLVGYPVLQLAGAEKDAHAYLRRLEEVLIRSLADFCIAARRHAPHTGVWVDDPERGPLKIAAIGVRLSRWVSSHGFALNVSCALSDFDAIVPCGIGDYGVSSMQDFAGVAPCLDEVSDRIVEHFGVVFDREMGGLVARDRGMV